MLETYLEGPRGSRLAASVAGFLNIGKGRETELVTINLLPGLPVTLRIRHLHDPQELLVSPNTEVRAGQLLADLQHYRVELLTKQQAAHAQLIAAQEEDIE
jgi:multidrug efflux pump subunit AcrA (membrane-fusion protein)